VNKHRPEKKKLALEEYKRTKQVRATARRVGISASTLQNWIKEWKAKGYLDEPDEAVQGEIVPEQTEIDAFVLKAITVRDKALNELERHIDMGVVKPRELISAVSMLAEKARLYQGLSTQNTETGFSREQLKDIFMEFFDTMVASARMRQKEIEGA
jgi:transposase-like protein